jgi:hypothetical protein
MLAKTARPRTFFVHLHVGMCARDQGQKISAKDLPVTADHKS